MKIKKPLALALSLAVALSFTACGADDKPPVSPAGTVSQAPSSDINFQNPVGSFQGEDFFASFNSGRLNCQYTLDFFEDGSVTISSPNQYSYGTPLENIKTDNGLIEFSLAATNPTFPDDAIPIFMKEQCRIDFSLKVDGQKLIGTAKQDKQNKEFIFEKISDTPREYKETENMTTEQMTEDAKIFFEILETKHPNIYYVQSLKNFDTRKDDYNKRKAALLEKIPTLDKKGFYYELRKILSSIGDAHTQIHLSQSTFDNELSFPIYVYYFSGKWHICGVDKQYKDFLGQEITAINDTPFDKVFEKLSELNTFENQATARQIFSIQHASPLFYAGIIDDTAKMTITLKGGKQFTLSSMKNSELISIGDTIMARREIYPETAHQDNTYYMYRTMDDMLYIQYNECADDANYPVSKFAQDIATELEKKPYKKLVIDLRNNGGGNSMLLDKYLLPIISAEKEKGAKIYCLIGGKTFSAAFSNAITLKATGAVLVGQPTGGNMRHFTEVAFYELPNSRFRGQYSQRFQDSDPAAPYDSLYPDVQIDHTIKAYMNGIDEEIEYIKKQ